MGRASLICSLHFPFGDLHWPSFQKINTYRFIAFLWLAQHSSISHLNHQLHPEAASHPSYPDCSPHPVPTTAPRSPCSPIPLYRNSLQLPQVPESLELHHHATWPLISPLPLPVDIWVINNTKIWRITENTVSGISGVEISLGFLALLEIHCSFENVIRSLDPHPRAFLRPSLKLLDLEKKM